MLDLLLAAALLLAFTAALFALGGRLTRGGAATAASRNSGLLAVAAVAGMVVGFLYVQDRLVLARLFPLTGIVVWGNTPLPLVGLLGGVLWSHLSGTRGRRVTVVGVLLLLGAVHAAKPFLGAPPPIRREMWVRGVAMQTSDSSCSAASAATLLRWWGVPGNEEEMARLAFTRNDGTAMLGVYRALRRKTDGTRFRVDVLSSATEEDLRRATLEGPVLISVGLDRFPAANVDPRYQSEWGWTPGLRHAVVLFRFLPDGKMEMGDPSVGREKWGVESLKVLWRGEGIRLIPR